MLWVAGAALLLAWSACWSSPSASLPRGPGYRVIGGARQATSPPSPSAPAGSAELADTSAFPPHC